MFGAVYLSTTVYTGYGSTAVEEECRKRDLETGDTVRQTADAVGERGKREGRREGEGEMKDESGGE